MTQTLAARFEARAFWSEPDGGYIAVSPAFPRLSAFGASAAAALEELETVLAAALEIYAEEGWPVPQPG